MNKRLGNPSPVSDKNLILRGLVSKASNKNLVGTDTK